MGTAEELAKLEGLRRTGVLNQAEFETAKSRLLDRDGGAESAAATPTAAGKPRKRKDWLLVVGGVAGVLALLIVYSTIKSQIADNRPAPAFTPPAPIEVVYNLTGSARSADITYSTATGQSQQQGVDVPLTTKDGRVGLHPAGFSSGAFLYFSAQNTGSFGTLTCRIFVDGQVVSENTASGAYAIATCSGRA